ncbi:GMC oxidoreductase [Mycolicibacterium mengxianglii]|uniref:GMC oxidoreductase n=1 Tax=Mycolicibacterium mengxianglii TaxID=2736649 RepID=UPI0018D1D57A
MGVPRPCGHGRPLNEADGVTGLCIADSSILPQPISSNTNATVYAIAERAADLLRQA